MLCSHIQEVILLQTFTSEITVINRDVGLLIQLLYIAGRVENRTWTLEAVDFSVPGFLLAIPIAAVNVQQNDLKLE